MDYQVRSQITLDYTGMISSPQNPRGFKSEELLGLQNVLDQAQATLEIRREAGELDFSKLLTSMKTQLPEIIDYANTVAPKYDNFVILGIGGSALGPLAVQRIRKKEIFSLLLSKRGINASLFQLESAGASQN